MVVVVVAAANYLQIIVHTVIIMFVGNLKLPALAAYEVPYLCMYRPQPNFQTNYRKNNFLGILFQE
jgi:hypothetical protein